MRLLKTANRCACSMPKKIRILNKTKALSNSRQVLPTQERCKAGRTLSRSRGERIAGCAVKRYGLIGLTKLCSLR